MQNRRTVRALVNQSRAVGTQTEQSQIKQRQTYARHQASPNGVAGQQTRFGHTTGTRGIDDNDTEYHGSHGVHGQIAVDETVGERSGLIGFHRVADRACRPDNSGNGEHNQRQNFQRCQEVTHGIQQFTRVERHQDDQRKVDKAVDKQRQLTVTGQRRNTNFKRHGCRTRRGEQRPHGKITNGRQQDASHFTNRRTQAIDATTDFRQSDHGQHRQTHGGNQEANGCGPDVRACLQTNHRRENDVACANKQRKGHKAQGDDVTRFQLMGHM